MNETIVPIPTLNDKPDDFQTLFGIWNGINYASGNVRFDFTACNFLRPNAVAFLGGLGRLIESRNCAVAFDWDTVQNEKVLANLCENGFAGAFQYPQSGWDGNSIPYREDRQLDMNAIMDYLTYHWIGKGWVHVSDRLRDAIVGCMWEIYSNAFEHSGSAIGVFSCGQYFKTMNDLILSVVDFGRGIPATVRAFLRRYVDDDRVSRFTGAMCLKWAFERGNSTCLSGVARGLGLDLLKEFVCANQGKLEIYSNDGYVKVDRDEECFANCPFSFDGTVVHITIRCDERLYKIHSNAVTSISRSAE